jgi:hypothetical protein
MPVCFWCERFIQIYAIDLADRHTKDHIIPYSLGGTREDGNLVDCCAVCNGDRSVPLSVAFNVRQLVVNMPYLSPKAIEKEWSRLRKNRTEILAQQDRWRQLEMLRLGHSPTGALDLIVLESETPPAEYLLASRKEIRVRPHLLIPKSVKRKGIGDLPKGYMKGYSKALEAARRRAEEMFNRRNHRLQRSGVNESV